jgi:hypothetical protein
MQSQKIQFQFISPRKAEICFTVRQNYIKANFFLKICKLIKTICSI